MQKPAHSKPETAFYSLDTSRNGISQVQLAQLLCSLYSFQKSSGTRQAAMQLRRLLAEAYRQLKFAGQTSDAISWKQVLELVTVAAMRVERIHNKLKCMQRTTQN